MACLPCGLQCRHGCLVCFLHSAICQRGHRRRLGRRMRLIGCWREHCRCWSPCCRWASRMLDFASITSDAAPAQLTRTVELSIAQEERCPSFAARSLVCYFGCYFGWSVFSAEIGYQWRRWHPRWWLSWRPGAVCQDIVRRREGRQRAARWRWTWLACLVADETEVVEGGRRGLPVCLLPPSIPLALRDGTAAGHEANQCEEKCGADNNERNHDGPCH